MKDIITKREDVFLAKIAGRDVGIETMTPSVPTNMTEKLMLEIAERVDDIEETAGGAPGDIQPLLEEKADKDHTVITGSLSLGRKAGTAVGANSTAVGTDCEASGPNAHAEGLQTVASGKYAASHAEGERTTASGPRGAHAEGCHTTAYGESSHAEGRATEADAQYAHAEGFFCGAHGIHSHAEGSFCRAYGRYSHVEGNTNDAMGDYQHVQGRYCIPDEDGIYAHIVGNGHIADEDQGETEDVHSNAHTLDWDGNAWFAGNVRIGGTDYASGTPLVTQADVPPRVDIRFGIQNGNAINISITASIEFADLCAAVFDYGSGADYDAVLPDVRIIAANNGQVEYYQASSLINDGNPFLRIIGHNGTINADCARAEIIWNGTNATVTLSPL